MTLPEAMSSAAITRRKEERCYMTDARGTGNPVRGWRKGFQGGDDRKPRFR